MQFLTFPFRTEIISNLGFSTIKTTLMDCVGNSFQVVGLMLGGYIASNFKNSEFCLLYTNEQTIDLLCHPSFQLVFWLLVLEILHA